jgi:hypothetical protein
MFISYSCIILDQWFAHLLRDEEKLAVNPVISVPSPEQCKEVFPCVDKSLLWNQGSRSCCEAWVVILVIFCITNAAKKGKLETNIAFVYLLRKKRERGVIISLVQGAGRVLRRRSPQRSQPLPFQVISGDIIILSF